VEIPLLLIYWYRTSESPSTVISLDSAVVVPFDHEDPGAWNTHCFSVVHVKETSRVTRTFSVSKKGRDSWVYFINQVLLKHTKATSPSKSPRNPTSPERDSIWSGDLFITDPMLTEHRSQLCLPTSPRVVEQLPLPRPDVLFGESFVP